MVNMNIAGLPLMQAQCFSCSRIGNSQPWIQADDRYWTSSGHDVQALWALRNVCGEVRRLRITVQGAAVGGRVAFAKYGAFFLVMRLEIRGLEYHHMKRNINKRELCTQKS
jgi:hypothetical protein